MIETIKLYDHSTEKIKGKGDNSIIYSALTNYDGRLQADSLSLKYTISGYEKYYINNNQYKVESGKFIITPPDLTIDAKFSNPTPVESLCIQLSNDLINAAFNNLIFSNDLSENMRAINLVHDLNVYQSIDANTTVQSTVNSIIQHFNSPEIIAEKLQLLAQEVCNIQLQLNTKLVRIERIKKSTKSEIFHRIEKAKNFIELNFKDEINLDLIAENSALTKFDLIRYFKQIYQQTPYQYLMHLRLLRAKELIFENKYALETIALKLNFADLPSFSKAFKNYFGISPSKIAR
jgi:AraC family transcriptional regulator